MVTNTQLRYEMGTKCIVNDILFGTFIQTFNHSSYKKIINNALLYSTVTLK